MLHRNRLAAQRHRSAGPVRSPSRRTPSRDRRDRTQAVASARLPACRRDGDQTAGRLFRTARPGPGTGNRRRPGVLDRGAAHDRVVSRPRPVSSRIGPKKLGLAGRMAATFSGERRRVAGAPGRPNAIGGPLPRARTRARTAAAAGAGQPSGRSPPPQPTAWSATRPALQTRRADAAANRRPPLPASTTPGCMPCKAGRAVGPTGMGGRPASTARSPPGKDRWR